MALANQKVPVAEYTPNEVKQAVAGYGGADKRQIQEMVRILLDLQAVPKPDDAADALAIAICHIHTAHTQRMIDELGQILRLEVGMIATLNGIVQSINTDSLVIDLGGLGILVYVPAPLAATSQPGERLFLHTYLVVRQDALQLFGFETHRRARIF